MEKPSWPFELKPLSWGAESNLYLSTYLERKVVVKHRFRKPYMREELAGRLIRERTLAEARILLSANEAGVKAPLPLYVDIDKGLLVMEFIEGVLLRDAITGLSRVELAGIAEKLGTYVAALHNKGIVHGDLTTSNVILRGNDVYLLDFGLAYFSARPTDKASDIRVLERAVISSHPGVFELFFPLFLQSYRSRVNQSDEVMKEFLKLSTMGRYYKKRFFF